MTNRLKTFLAAALLFITMMFIGKCKAQVKQFQVSQICADRECRNVSGVVAITDKTVFIKIDTVKSVELDIYRTFHIKGKTYYELKHRIYSGLFILYPPEQYKAYLDIYINGHGYI